MTAPAAAALRRNSFATSACEGEGEARRRWWRTRGSSEAARTRRRQAQRRRPCWPRSGTRAQALESERERAGSEEEDGEGVLVPLLIGSRAQGVHDAWSSGGGAWRPRTGRVSSVGAFSRTVGGRRRDQRGTRFWAISKPNQDLGRIRRSKPARSSTFFIKAL